MMNVSVEFKRALKFSLPTLFAYFPLGIIFAILWVEAGFPGYWAVTMSAVAFAGAVQFVALSMMQAKSGVLAILLAGSFVAFRNVFYGLSLLERFKYKPKLIQALLIFGLVDATYAVLTTVPEEPGQDDTRFCFYSALFPWIYWVGGTLLGTLLSDSIPTIHGLDFMMAGFFMILVVDYYLLSRDKLNILMPLLFAAVSFLLLPRQYLLLSILFSAIFIYVMEHVAAQKEQGDS